MDLVFIVIGWLSIPMLLVSVMLLVRQWHKSQRMTKRRLLQPVVLAGSSLAFHTIFLRVELDPMNTWLPLLAGGLAGVAISRNEDLRIQAGKVVSTKTAWSYIVWGAGFALSQGIVMRSPGSASVALLAVWATTGLTSGEHLGLFQRRRRLLHPVVNPAPSASSIAVGVLLLVIGGLVLVGAPSTARAEGDTSILAVANGEVDGLSVDVAGSGLTYKGDSIQLFFDNQTGEQQKVHVPIGTRFVPVDSSVQTMHSAGDERIGVPPGASTSVIRAFCGNKHKSGPGVWDSFTPQPGDPNSEEVRILQRSHDLFERGEATDDEIQRALWSRTDGIDVTGEETTERIIGDGEIGDAPGEGEPSDTRRGAAGAAGAAPTTLVALQGLRRRITGDDGDGDGGDGGDGDGDGDGGPGPDPLVDENGELVHPDENGLYDQYVDGEWRKVTRDEAANLIRDAEHWQRVNEQERQQALEDHADWADRQWDDFVEDCKQRAAADRAAAAAERADRQWRLDTADRLETVALRNGYYDMIKWLDKDGNALPTADQLSKLREFLGRRMADDAATRRYFDGKSDFDFFAEGVQDDAAWVANKVGTAIGGQAAGSIAEFMVRNPEVPLRILLAVKTGGLSEIPFVYNDMHRGLNAAADAKMRDQNLDLTGGEEAWEIAKVGLWEIGGRVGGDVAGSVLSGKGVKGAYTGVTGATDEVAEAAARAGTKTATEETGDRFVQRVLDRNPKWSGKSGPGTAPPMNTEVAMRFSDATRAGPSADDFVRNVLREGDEVPLNHLHETGLTAKQVRSAGKMCREEGVEALGRTTNMDSMRHIRDGTGVAKPLTIKAKTINQLDGYLNPNIKAGDEGLVGFFRPIEPDRNMVPDHLYDDVMDRLKIRTKQYEQLGGEVDRLVAKGEILKRNGKLIDAATGKPFTGDWDAVMFRDAATKKVIGPGAQYEHLKNRWINDVGGQHGAEVNVVDDIAGGYRPGTPEYQHALDKAEQLKATLQQSHTGGGEIVVQVGPDGVLRRGPVGADVNLTPGLEDFAPSTPAPAMSVPTAPATATTPSTARWPLVTNRPEAAADVGGALAGAGREGLTGDRT